MRCDRIQNNRFFTFLLMEFFLSTCLSIPFWPFLLALRSLPAQSSKEGCACLCFPPSRALLVPSVVLLPLVFIVAINAGWLIFPVLGNQSISCWRCEHFSVTNPPVHEKSSPSVDPLCGPLGPCDCTAFPDRAGHWPGDGR